MYHAHMAALLEQTGASPASPWGRIYGGRALPGYTPMHYYQPLMPALPLRVVSPLEVWLAQHQV